MGAPDIDSPKSGRFTEENEKGLLLLADKIGETVDYEGIRFAVNQQGEEAKIRESERK